MRQDHRSYRLPEIPTTVDSPMFIEPDGFVGPTNCSLNRPRPWRESSQCQPAKAFMTVLELDAVRRGFGDLLDHA
jgi:hypothetical protein